MLQLQYPFGLPTIYTRRGAGRRCTLKTFLKKYKNELVDGLWTITVDGDLEFLQDLIVSKYGVDNNKAARSIMANYDDEFSIDNSHKQLPGKTVLTTSQINNATLTSDILEVIEAVASAKEYGSVMKLTVSTAIYYPKSKQLSNEDWVNEIWQRPGELVVKNDQHINDDRSRYWTAIPIKDFIGVIIDERKKHKKLIQQKGDYHDTLQQGLKLMINNFYGSIASKDYAHNNVVVANNITSKTRVGVWMMAKALRLRQTITDGGMYCIDDINYLKTETKSFKRPGLHILYNRDNETQKYLKQKSLFDSSIISDIKVALDNNDKEEIQSLQNHIDQTALNHIQDFWSTYALQFKYNIEHKICNTAFRASYSGKADYALELVSPQAADQSKIYNGVLFKLRGENSLKTSGKMKHMYRLLYPDCGISDEEIEISFKSMLVSIKEAQRIHDATHEMILPGAEQITQQVYSITPLHEQILPQNETEHKKLERNLNNRKKAIISKHTDARFVLPSDLSH